MPPPSPQSTYQPTNQPTNLPTHVLPNVPHALHCFIQGVSEKKYHFHKFRTGDHRSAAPDFLIVYRLDSLYNNSWFKETVKHFKVSRELLLDYHQLSLPIQKNISGQTLLLQLLLNIVQGEHL